MTNTGSDNSREWAAQAYALLKKRQEEQKHELKKSRGLPVSFSWSIPKDKGPHFFLLSEPLKYILWVYMFCDHVLCLEFTHAPY